MRTGQRVAPWLAWMGAVVAPSLCCVLYLSASTQPWLTTAGPVRELQFWGALGLFVGGVGLQPSERQRIRQLGSAPQVDLGRRDVAHRRAGISGSAPLDSGLVGAGVVLVDRSDAPVS